MNTENLKIVFEDYLSKKNTTYALLLNGKWGSGKTFFWENTLQKLCKKQELKPIYVSLNGLKKLDALESKLFLKLLPYLKNQENSIIKNATAIGFNFLNSFIKKKTDTTLTELLKNVSIDVYNFEDNILCFDDLERCQISIKEVLGYINEFVEHKKVKVVILSDESEFSIEQKNEYNYTKEKLIRYTLNYEPDVKQVFPFLCDKFKNNNTFHNFLIERQNQIIDLFNEYQQKNLRTLIFFLDVLQKQFESISDTGEEYISEIIFFSIIITLEFKTGKLQSTEFKDYKGLPDIEAQYQFRNIWENNEIRRKTIVAEHTKTYAEGFYEKYLLNRNKKFTFYKSIYSYILSGYLNEVELKSEIEKRKPIESTREQFVALKILNYNFRELSEEDFQNFITEIIDYIKNGRYIIYDYANILSWFLYFIRENLISIDKEELKEIIETGLDISKNNSLPDESKTFQLKHSPVDDEYIKEIVNKVLTIHQNLKNAEFIRNGNDLVKVIENANEIEMISLFQKYETSDELLKYADGKAIAKALLHLENRQIKIFTELVSQRCTISKASFLTEEKKCYQNIRGYLKENIEQIDKTKKIKYFLLCCLIEALDKCIGFIDEYSSY